MLVEKMPCAGTDEDATGVPVGERRKMQDTPPGNKLACRRIMFNIADCIRTSGR
jgi:hypothetical protein